jgi:hypothetical protein
VQVFPNSFFPRIALLPVDQTNALEEATPDGAPYWWDHPDRSAWARTNGWNSQWNAGEPSKEAYSTSGWSYTHKAVIKYGAGRGGSLANDVQLIRLDKDIAADVKWEGVIRPTAAVDTYFAHAMAEISRLMGTPGAQGSSWIRDTPEIDKLANTDGMPRPGHTGFGWWIFEENGDASLWSHIARGPLENDAGLSWGWMKGDSTILLCNTDASFVLETGVDISVVLTVAGPNNWPQTHGALISEIDNFFAFRVANEPGYPTDAVIQHLPAEGYWPFRFYSGDKQAKCRVVSYNSQTHTLTFRVLGFLSGSAGQVAGGQFNAKIEYTSDQEYKTRNTPLHKLASLNAAIAKPIGSRDSKWVIDRHTPNGFVSANTFTGWAVDSYLNVSWPWRDKSTGYLYGWGYGYAVQRWKPGLTEPECFGLVGPVNQNGDGYDSIIASRCVGVDHKRSRSFHFPFGYRNDTYVDDIDRSTTPGRVLRHINPGGGPPPIDYAWRDPFNQGVYHPQTFTTTDAPGQAGAYRALCFWWAAAAMNQNGQPTYDEINDCFWFFMQPNSKERARVLMKAAVNPSNPLNLIVSLVWAWSGCTLQDMSLSLNQEGLTRNYPGGVHPTAQFVYDRREGSPGDVWTGQSPLPISEIWGKDGQAQTTYVDLFHDADLGCLIFVGRAQRYGEIIALATS